MSFIFKSECKECNGSGSWEHGPECSKPASDCCGGCTRTVKCEACDGDGVIEKTFTDEKLQEIIQFHFEGEPILAHEVVMDY